YPRNTPQDSLARFENRQSNIHPRNREPHEELTCPYGMAPQAGIVFDELLSNGFGLDRPIFHVRLPPNTRDYGFHPTSAWVTIAAVLCEKILYFYGFLYGVGLVKTKHHVRLEQAMWGILRYFLRKLYFFMDRSH